MRVRFAMETRFLDFKYSTALGARVPCYSCAPGKAMAARLRCEQQDDLVKRLATKKFTATARVGISPAGRFASYSGTSRGGEIQRMNIARLSSLVERRGAAARAIMRRSCALTLMCVCAWNAELAAAETAAEPSFSPEQIEFFEKNVRPVLIARCFECHSSDAKKVEASLLVESRHQLLAGGDNGPAIVPGQPEESLSIESAYQMSSRYDEKNFKADGDNRLLWRMNLRRLDAEAWRDALLAVGGDLDRAQGGPPIDDVNATRRTIYLKVSRNGDLLPPDQFLRLFDYPAMRATVDQRTSNVVPQQYLFMMNNQYMLRRAELLAARLLQVSPSNEVRIERAYRLLFGRVLTAEEIEIGVAYLTSTQNATPTDEPSRWRQYAQVLLSSNEFMHIE